MSSEQQRPAVALRTNRITATSPQAMRDQNLHALLDVFWASEGRNVTATALMETSGLTRATVLDVCRDLQAQGWIQQVAVGPDRTPGRQAGQFAFSRTRWLVVGADIGYHSVTAIVSDLTGRVLGRGRRSFPHAAPEISRSDSLGATIHEALTNAQASPDQVKVACVGIAAPSQAGGSPPSGNPYWDSVRLGPNSFLADQREWEVVVENDANLAAWAERNNGSVDPDSTFITLLSGERLGAGLVFQGTLQRGAHGAAGEMGYLERVVGVHSSLGIADQARVLAMDMLRTGRPSVLSDRGDSPDEGPSAEEILRAAAAGDALAGAVVELLSEQFGIAIATMCYLIDPAVVVIAGGIAGSAAPVIDSLNRSLQQLLPSPPVLLASTLGSDVVVLGAVQIAIDRVRAEALPTPR